MQENHYDPFGYTLAGQTYTDGSQTVKNDYLYNGKELQDELGLDWYAYGFRMYDPVLGRFPSIDPIAEEFEWVSPYNYAENEPIACVDLHGLQKVSVIADATIGTDDEGFITSATSEQRDNSPILAGIKDASYVGLTYLLPLNLIDNSIAGFFNPEMSITEAAQNAVAIGLGSAVPEGGGGLSRKGAFNEAKRDLGIPKSEQPIKNNTGKQYEKVPMTDKKGKAVLDKNGKPIMSREYSFNKDGKIVKIQDHSAGHQYKGEAKGSVGAHFNVRPQENTRTGKVKETKEHYEYIKKK